MQHLCISLCMPAPFHNRFLLLCVYKYKYISDTLTVSDVPVKENTCEYERRYKCFYLTKMRPIYINIYFHLWHNCQFVRAILVKLSGWIPITIIKVGICDNDIACKRFLHYWPKGPHPNNETLKRIFVVFCIVALCKLMKQHSISWWLETHCVSCDK